MCLFKKKNKSQINIEKCNALISAAKEYYSEKYVAAEPANDIRYALPHDNDIKFSRKETEQAQHIFKLKPIIPQSTFSDKLLTLVTDSGEKDSTIYKAAGIDRRHYSKIISKKNYQPSKDTCIAFALALKLDIQSTTDLIASAVYSLSHSIKRDLYIEYFILVKEYDLEMVNAVLVKLGEKPLN